MGLSRAMERAPWRVGDASSRTLLDVASGRSVSLERPLTDAELELAIHHGLIGLMADHENAQLRTAALPVYVRLAARHSVMNRHLRRILDRLNRAEVRATVIKGLHLAGWAYGNPDHRTTTDIDLLVPANDVDRALQVVAEDEAVRMIPAKTPKAEKRNIPFVDETGLRFMLDLHWDLFSYTQLRGCAAAATDWAWEKATFVADHALGPLWQLPPEARVAFLGTHALLDHRFRLILFRDLAEVANSHPEWDGLIRFAKQWQLRTTTYLSLLIASGLVGANVPRTVLEALRTSAMPVPYLERKLPTTDFVRFNGHKLHPVNLATVLVHDDRRSRAKLAVGAPMAFPGWWKRVSTDVAHVPVATTRRRSILLLVSSNRRRGAEVFGERLGRGLRAKGWDVDFVALHGAENGPTVDAVPLSSRPNVGRFDAELARELRRMIKRTRPGVVFANGGSTLRYAVPARLGLRSPPRLVYASIGEPEYWLRDRRHVLVQRTLHRQADLILAVSETTRHQLIDLFGIPAERIQTAHTGVPESFFDIPIGTDGAEFRLVFLGNLSIEKGPRAAIEAIARLSKHIPVRLRFVGTGPLQADLERVGADLGVSASLEFMGSVEDVRPHLGWADALLLTSKTEGLPGVVLEAAAAGIPSVAFDVGGTQETIINGETGIVVSAGDPDALDAALLELARNPEARIAMGFAARDRVHQKFLVEHAVARHDDVLSRLIAEERLPSPPPST